jgi:anti-anti-sigma factor
MSDSRDDLYVSIQERGNKTSVMLAGTVDVHNVSSLIDALGVIRPSGQASVVVDIGQLDFLGACGINALVLSAARFARRRCPLSIVGADPVLQASSVGTPFSSLFIWPGDGVRSPSTLHAA